ncbi:hypothetical protein MLD38_009270 [Melastoma candidum]|uniref:Uncharacterized protein n=1 Tax=Melastoma candidum TaxID=119954 RepID=A0ACB9RYA8_9MYRT|nr:hypothetical protein MLD38_009270 [Melastoma candidum]
MTQPVNAIPLVSAPATAADKSKPESIPFTADFMATMQEMIRAEVRNYMSGLERNMKSAAAVGMCSQAAITEGVRNALAKRIRIRRME